MEKKESLMKYVWMITYSHVIAYFVAGIFALVFVGYKELFATESLSLLMKPVTAPIVALGPALQIFRGILIAGAIYPLREIFFKKKHGYLYLGIFMLVFSLLSTIGPTSGSFDGFIYTTIPIKYQLLGYPEAFLYVVLFLGLIKLSNKFKNRRIILILSIVIVCLILFMSVMGYLTALA